MIMDLPTMGGKRQPVSRSIVTCALAALLALSPAVSSAPADDDPLSRAITIVESSAKTDAERAEQYYGLGKIAGDETMRLGLLQRSVACAVKSRKTKGFAAGEKSLDLLAEHVPGRADDWALRRAELYRAWSRVPTKREEKDQVHDKLVEALEAATDVHERRRDWETAATTCREAAALAGRVRHRLRGALLQRQRRVDYFARAQRKAASQVKLLEKTPDKISLRMAVIKALAIELDRPDEAAKHLTADVPEAWRTYLPLAAGKTEKLQAPDCQGLGDWYLKTLAEEAKEPSKENLLLRAKGYYEAFLRKHAEQDAASLKAKFGLQQVAEALAKLGHKAMPRDVVGAILASADDRYLVRINGKVVAQGGLQRPVATKVVLNPGDQITVRLTDIGGAVGFCFLFQGKKDGIEFSTDVRSWFVYQPNDEKSWWNIKPAGKSTPATPGRNGRLLWMIKQAAARPPATLCQEIWGQGRQCFLYHVVTADELRKSDLRWVSQDATYRASSHWRQWKEMPALLTGKGQLYGGEFAFHTNREKSPHIVIQLRQTVAIRRIVVENRRGHGQERAKGLMILTSTDAKQWKRVWTAGAGQPAWIIDLPAPVTARYVKIGLPRVDFLHLAGVRIYAK